MSQIHTFIYLIIYLFMWENDFESPYFDEERVFSNVFQLFSFLFFFFTIYLYYRQNCCIMLGSDKVKTIKSIHTDLLKIFLQPFEAQINVKVIGKSILFYKGKWNLIVLIKFGL